jgi:hypothetical protein
MRAELLRMQANITAPVSPQARENLRSAIAKYKVSVPCCLFVVVRHHSWTSCALLIVHVQKVWQDRRRKVYEFLDMACGDDGSVKELEVCRLVGRPGKLAVTCCLRPSMRRNCLALRRTLTRVST